MNEALKKAAEIAGGYSALAAKLGVKQPAISQWFSKGVPAARVLPITRATEGEVTPHELRPDLYPDPKWLPEDVRHEGGQKAA